jgi:hypothetical protein
MAVTAKARVEADAAQVRIGLRDVVEHGAQPQPRDVTVQRHAGLGMEHPAEVERRHFERPGDR